MNTQLTVIHSLVQTILFLIFSGFETYVSVLGFVALGLESTLPIPQLITSVHAHSPLWMGFLTSLHDVVEKCLQQLQATLTLRLPHVDLAGMVRW